MDNLVPGYIVYTVNAKTNTVDSWTCEGFIRQKGELLVHLTNGKKYCFLPARCVYASKEKALEIAKKQ